MFRGVPFRCSAAGHLFTRSDVVDVLLIVFVGLRLTARAGDKVSASTALHRLLDLFPPKLNLK